MEMAHLEKTSDTASLSKGKIPAINLRCFFLLSLLLVAAAFPKVFLGIDTFFYRDFGVLGYPYGVFFRDSILGGELPLWNPYSHCGIPFLAQWGTWYPPSLLGLLLPMPWGTNFFILLHLAWGATGMYWLTRRFGLGALAGSFAGIAYTFNGVTLSCLLWGNYIAALAWMPWLVGSAMQSWRFGGRWTVIAALVGALQVLTATPELTLLTWLLIGAIWLGEVFSKQLPFAFSARQIGTIVLVAAALTMVQMLPFFDLLQHAQRTTNYGTQKWAMQGWGWANLFVPLFHCYKSPDGLWFQSDQEFLASYYLGIGVLALAVTGVWLKRSTLTFVLAGMAVFCWIMALGNEGFLYAILRRIFPIVGIARYPIKFVIPTGFVVALLGGWAVDGLLKSPQRSKRILLVMTGCLSVLAGGFVILGWLHPFRDDHLEAMSWNAAWRVLIMILLFGGLFLSLRMTVVRSRCILQFLILLLIPIDAMTHSPHMMPTLPKAFLSPGFWQASGRPQSPRLGEGRIMLTPQAEDHLLYSIVTNQQADFTGKRLAEWSNLNLVDRIPKVNGAMTLRPAHFDELEQYMYFSAGTKFGYGLADFLSAAWISSPVNPVQWVSRTNYLPVITAGQNPILVNDSDALKGITDLEFNPREVVYLNEAWRSVVSVTNRSEIMIQQTQFRLNEVKAEVLAIEPGMVVLSQSYYPNWKAYVDGKVTPLIRANLAFQALQVPAGKHEIRFVYQDRKLLIGGIISILGLLSCFLLWKRSSPVGFDQNVQNN